jgi:hypothetical protein
MPTLTACPVLIFFIIFFGYGPDNKGRKPRSEKLPTSRGGGTKNARDETTQADKKGG